MADEPDEIVSVCWWDATRSQWEFFEVAYLDTLATAVWASENIWFVPGTYRVEGVA